MSDATNRIQRFAPDGSFVTTWGSTGSGPGLFEGLTGLAVDTSGHVYAADALAHGDGRAIQEFDSVGNLLASLGNFSATTNSSLPPLMGQVATYGSDVVYAVGFGTIYRFELTVPDASLSVQPSPARVGQPITATATASVPFGSVSGYAFDFGVDVPATPGPSSVASHTYSTPGTYQVTARVTSSRAGTATVAKTITVVSPPINTSPPSIVGGPIERDALTAIHGGWNNPPITGYSIRWLRCDAAGNRCEPLATTGAQKYVLRTADVGHTIRVVEAALNTTGISQPATSSPTAVVKALPRLTGASASPAAFHAARSGKSITTSRAIGTKVQYVLNIRANVRFTIDRVLEGRQVGRRCMPPAGKNLTARRCSRYVPMRGGFTVSAHAGKNVFRFSGRLSGSALAPGTYRLVATPSANGRSGDAKTITFTIMR